MRAVNPRQKRQPDWQPVHAFEWTLAPDEAAHAARLASSASFFRGGVFILFGPPILFSAVLGALLTSQAPQWVLVAITSAFLALAVLMPINVFVITPAQAKRLARQSPLRRVSLSDAGIAIQLGAGESRTRWRDLRGICAQDGHLIVAAGLFRSFAIPFSFLPAGAHGFIVSHFTASRGCRIRVR